MPKRIQFKRQKGFQLPENCKRVTRPSKFGNPFKVGDWVDFTNSRQLMASVQIHSVELAISLFEAHLILAIEDEPNFLAPLKGKDLACFCREDAKCHADILLDYANR